MSTHCSVCGDEWEHEDDAQRCAEVDRQILDVRDRRRREATERKRRKL